MSQLEQHFRQSGYTIHIGGQRLTMLPECCRRSLVKTDKGIKYLGADGKPTVLTVMRCEICGREYVENEKKYTLIDNPIKYEFVTVQGLDGFIPL